MSYHRQSKNSWIWSIDPSGSYIVKSAYSALHNWKFGTKVIDVQS